MQVKEPFLPAAHPTAPLPQAATAPCAPDTFPAAAPLAAFLWTVATFSTAAVTADTVSRGERTVMDTGTAVAAAWAAAAAEVMAGDGSLSVSNYST